MDDFGNSIVAFHRPSMRGFAAYVLCAEGSFAPVIASEQYLAQMGVVA